MPVTHHPGYYSPLNCNEAVNALPLLSVVVQQLPGARRRVRPIPILVDDRESSLVSDALRQSPELDVTVTRLKLGDYVVDGRFLFERKTVFDLIVSIVDGRLFSQSQRLASSPLRPVLIIEGDDSEVASFDMKWESIQGALVTVTLFFGIPVLRTHTGVETAQTMLISARQANTVATGALPRHGYRPLGKRARQLFILQGLPGIGPRRARLLLERFGSVESVMNATLEDLQSVKSVGERGAGKIRWAVEEPAHPYC